MYLYLVFYFFYTSIYLSVSLEVTVTSLNPPRMCRFAVFSVKPTFLSESTYRAHCDRPTPNHDRALLRASRALESVDYRFSEGVGDFQEFAMNKPTQVEKGLTAYATACT